MALIGIAGLPGSGKTRLMDEYEQKGFSRFDDINRDWSGNLQIVRDKIEQGRDVAISDIMFCDEDWRRKLENELGLAVQWIFFENNRWHCAKNCLYRFIFEQRHRPLQTEIEKICQLSTHYEPHGDVRLVMPADEA